MLSLFTLFGTTFATIYATYLLLASLNTRKRSSRASQSDGCKAIPKVLSWDPLFGLDTFISISKADVAGRRSEAYRTLHKKYGPTFQMKSLGVNELQTAHPENIQAICTSAFNDFGVGPMRGTIGAPFLGRGIFTEDGNFWKHSRALIRPTFNRAEITDLGGFEWHVARFLALIPKDGSTFDLLPLSKKLVSTDILSSYYDADDEFAVFGYVNRIPLWNIDQIFGSRAFN